MFTEDDIKKWIPTIIDTFCELFGEEYRESFSQRANSLKYFIYYDSASLLNYYNFILSCKRKELGIKYLDYIGIDTSKNRNKSFSEPLDFDLDELLLKYIGYYDNIGSITDPTRCYFF